MMADENDDTPDGARLEAVRVSTATCPICGEATHARYRPFCSKRCADVDLHRWLGGVYRMPTQEVPDPDLLDAELRAAGRRAEGED
ncbi:DNA gyrase inhibitor YacG [Novispirillum sp. DQ9]|uniref:DNA gyrase inhibitor YacG n=1 Tax=Novispirillum sp. DQ9 TaxID=3398612 RepID=UPI003C7A8025